VWSNEEGKDRVLDRKGFESLANTIVDLNKQSGIFYTEVVGHFSI